LAFFILKEPFGFKHFPSFNEFLGFSILQGFTSTLNPKKYFLKHKEILGFGFAQAKPNAFEFFLVLKKPFWLKLAPSLSQANLGFLHHE